MKTLLLLTLSILFLGGLSHSQNTLLVYTKFPTHLNFVDENDRAIPVKSIWNQADGGIMLNFQKLENTYVVADELVNFKLSDQNRLTKLIALDTENKISLHKCFTSEKYCCEKLTDKQKKGTEKLLAVSVMKKSAAANAPLIFSNSNISQIQDLSDLSINWQTDVPVSEIYLVDISTLETIWQSKDFETNIFSQSDLKLQDIGLEKNHKYQLNIQLQTTTPEAGKFTYEFDYADLAFTGSDYHFATPQAVKIAWKTTETVQNIKVENTEGEILWENSTESSNEFELSKLPEEVASKFKAGLEYSIRIKLNNNQDFEYQFMVLLDNSESDELKNLLDF